MKLLAVFNTCGISGRENVSSYIASIKNILNQDFDDFRVLAVKTTSKPSKP